MLYKEGPLPKKEANKREHFTEPYNSPTHAGGLFAIKRDWFKELGWYDPGEYMLTFNSVIYAVEKLAIIVIVTFFTITLFLLH